MPRNTHALEAQNLRLVKLTKLDALHAQQDFSAHKELSTNMLVHPIQSVQQAQETQWNISARMDSIHQETLALRARRITIVQLALHTPFAALPDGKAMVQLEQKTDSVDV